MAQAFKERVIYQIYPSSFKDSNNDGRGDLKGIISKLDYLKKLGIGIIWLSPIYESPMDDMGYDISDYYNINKLFGDMNDFDNLILEAKKRDILIVMDLVINHTSTKSKWFIEALNGNEKYKRYYYFEKGKKNKKPNNWDSAFTGSAWKKVPNSDEYYLCLFCDTQVDLNYHNEEVIKEVEKIIKYWLDKGVYGFRCDVINNIYKTSLRNDNFLKLYNKGTKYYQNQEGMFTILKRFRNDVLDHYDTFLVGETGAITPKIASRLINERCLDMFFEFDHIFADKSKLLPIFKRKFNAKKLMKALFSWQENVPYIANYLENHDQLRSISRYGDAKDYYKESGKLLALLLLTLKGTPVIYQGEEIGTLDYKEISYEECKDVAAKMAFKTVKKLLHLSDKKVWKLVNETINRDNARAPMQWDDSINGGFNEGKETWLKVNDDYKTINVKNEEKDGDSILNFYIKLIHFRNDDEVLKKGEFKRGYLSNSLNYFYRIYENRIYLIVLNFSKKTIKFNIPLKLRLILSNVENKDLNKLNPYFAGIFEVM